MKTCYFDHLWKRLIAYNPVLSDNEYQNSNADGVFNERFLNKSKIKMQMLCISQNNIFIDFTLVELKTWSESNLQKNGKIVCYIQIMENTRYEIKFCKLSFTCNCK